MQNKSTLAALAAVAAVLVLPATRGLQAAAPAAGLPAGTSLWLNAQAKASPGPGRCGTYKYWDRKKRACVSKLI